MWLSLPPAPQPPNEVFIAFKRRLLSLYIATTDKSKDAKGHHVRISAMPAASDRWIFYPRLSIDNVQTFTNRTQVPKQNNIPPMPQGQDCNFWLSEQHTVAVNFKWCLKAAWSLCNLIHIRKQTSVLKSIKQKQFYNLWYKLEIN